MTAAAPAQVSELPPGFPKAVRSPAELTDEQQALLSQVRERCSQGRSSEVSGSVERLMSSCGGCPPESVLLTYAEYLLRRGRPFSAGRALRPLLRRPASDPRARLLYAEALADSGNLERALPMVETLANEGAIVSATQVFDDLYSIANAGDRHPAAAVMEERLAQFTNHSFEQLLAPDALPVVDKLIGEWIRGDQLARANSPEAWAYYFGAYCCRHLGAVWSWRRRIEDSTLRVPLTTGSLELTPSVWARWRLESRRHRFSTLVRTLLLLRGARTGQIDQLLGSSEQGPAPGERGDPLSLALGEALKQQQAGQDIGGLGLAVDCPISRLRVPLILRDADKPRLVLEPSQSIGGEAFARYLDMLSLGPFGRLSWSVASGEGVATSGLRLYEPPDPGSRAVLVARRLCTEDAGNNARWAVTIAGTLLDSTLDGTVASISKVERIVLAELRVGGKERWDVLFEDRFALLFMLTCYVGEVLRRHYGGRWGADRVSGDALGPTSGLELAQTRYNLGARMLKCFFSGENRPLLPSACEYAQRAAALAASNGDWTQESR